MTFTDASCWPTLLEIKVLQWFLATANNLLLVLELAEVLWRWKKGSSDQAICFCIPTWRTTEKKVILKGSRVASGLCGTFIFKSGIYVHQKSFWWPAAVFITSGPFQNQEPHARVTTDLPGPNDQSGWFTCNQIEKRIHLQLTCALWVLTVIGLLLSYTL